MKPPSTPEQPTGAHCTQCGEFNTYNHQFCAKCGAKLPWAQQTSSQPVVPVQPVVPPKPAKKRTSCGTGCLAVVVGLFILGFITDQIGKNTVGNTTTSTGSTSVDSPASTGSSAQSSSPQKENKSAPSSSGDGFQEGEVKTVTEKGRTMTIALVDGKFYTIGSVERQRSIEDEFSKTTADGRFWIIKIVVQNSSDKGGTVATSLMKLVDDKNREFDTSSAGTTALLMSGDKTAEMFMGEINPGNSKTIALVFDVPKDANNFNLKVPPATFSMGKEALLPVPKPPFRQK